MVAVVPRPVREGGQTWVVIDPGLVKDLDGSVRLVSPCRTYPELEDAVRGTVASTRSNFNRSWADSLTLKSVPVRRHPSAAARL